MPKEGELKRPNQGEEKRRRGPNHSRKQVVDDEDAEEQIKYPDAQGIYSRRYLMISEVGFVLQEKLEQLEMMNEHSCVPVQTSEIFQKTMEYCQQFGRYRNPESLRQLRSTLGRYRLTDLEMCQFVNLCPSSIDEARCLIPTILDKGRNISDEDIEKIINDLDRIRSFE